MRVPSPIEEGLATVQVFGCQNLVDLGLAMDQRQNPFAEYPEVALELADSANAESLHGLGPLAPKPLAAFRQLRHAVV